MSRRWKDFLFVVAVRFVCGAVLGALVGVLILAPIGRSSARRPLLLLIFGDKHHPERPYYWFGTWSLTGAIIAMLGTPRWQTPWYRRQTEHLNLPGEGQSGPNIVKKSGSISTVGEDGVRHEYSSIEDVPPEIRSEIEGIEKEAMQRKANELSVMESSQSGNATTTKIVRRENVSVYKIVDGSGVERTYSSLEEMPPEIRAAVTRAQDKPAE
jgi:hypothetical protein